MGAKVDKVAKLTEFARMGIRASFWEETVLLMLFENGEALVQYVCMLVYMLFSLHSVCKTLHTCRQAKVCGPPWTYSSNDSYWRQR